ncbi:MAG: FG-GAP-like repeat-containing protein [Gemmatimonadota bacterium]
MAGGRGLSRRRRGILISLGTGALFAVAVAALVVRSRTPRPAYLPGDELEGLTAELARALPADYPRVSFTDVTRAAGIDFRHFTGLRTSQLPEDMGSGAAWGDYDGDGWDDLYVLNEAGPLTLSEAEVAVSPARAALYHNEGDGTFREVAEEAGVAYRGWGMGAAWGDYDNDGRADLVVSAYGRNVLYHNEGGGRFTDATREAGLGGPEGFWTGVSWADYDRDGDLDLYVTGYVRYAPPSAGEGATALQYDVEVPSTLNPSSFPPERNLLYRNEGNGTFREVAGEAGVAGRRGRSLSASWADLDEDGWPDLYVANDVSDNVLYRNRGDGTFEEVSHTALVADYRGAMGLALGDWDGDGDTDLFITHWIAQENALYVNRLRAAFHSLDTGPTNALQFMDQADRYGLGQIALDFVGWGTAFVDYDNDGRLDLPVVNGSTFQRDDAAELLVPMRDQLFWNRGNEDGFFDVSPVAGPYFRESHVGRGAAFADYDRDGDVDLFVVNHGEPGVLLRNDGGNRNGWLELRLRGTRSNRQAIGARLRLLAGGRVQLREVGGQSSYLSQNSLVVHFGLGPGGRADSLEIRWPSGDRQMIRALPRNRLLRVVEGEEVTVAGTPGNEVSLEATSVRRFWELYRAATRERTQERPREAARLYEEALKLNPAHEDALYYLGNVSLEAGDLPGAERAWLRLVAHNPRSGRGHAQLGVLFACFEENPDFDLGRAERELRRALSLNPTQVGLHLRLAVVALARGDGVQARSELEAVTGSHPESRAGHLLAGYLAWKGGDRREAARHLATVRDAPPSGPTPPHCALAEGWVEELSGAEDADRVYRKIDARLARARGGGASEGASPGQG